METGSSLAVPQLWGRHKSRPPLPRKKFEHPCGCNSLCGVCRIKYLHFSSRESLWRCEPCHDGHVPLAERPGQGQRRSREGVQGWLLTGAWIQAGKGWQPRQCHPAAGLNCSAQVKGQLCTSPTCEVCLSLPHFSSKDSAFSWVHWTLLFDNKTSLFLNLLFPLHFAALVLIRRNRPSAF